MRSTSSAVAEMEFPEEKVVLRAQYGTTAHHHPYPAEDKRQKKAIAELPSHYVTPVSHRRRFNVQKEQLASATTQRGYAETEEEKRERDEMPLFMGERDADLYYDFDEVAQEYGLLELGDLVDDNDEGGGGGLGTPGPRDALDNRELSYQECRCIRLI